MFDDRLLLHQQIRGRVQGTYEEGAFIGKERGKAQGDCESFALHDSRMFEDICECILEKNWFGEL